MNTNKITKQEIEILITGLDQNGEDRLFDLLLLKAIALLPSGNVDDTFLDAAYSLLAAARKQQDSALAKKYYKISFMIKRIAHKMYRSYKKGGTPRNDERFLRSV